MSRPSGGLAQVAVEPGEPCPVWRIGLVLSASGPWPGTRVVKGARRAGRGRPASAAEVGVGRWWSAAVEDQVAGKEHTGAAVEYHQVCLGVAVQGDQFEAVIAHRQRPGRERARRRNGLGAGHPVSGEAIHVFVEAAAFAVNALDGGGQGRQGPMAKAWLPRKWSGGGGC